MDKVVWLVGGNKGGAGKSVVAKVLVEWLREQAVPITIVDGDKRTPDVAAVFNGTLPTMQFDLHEDAGWAYYSDYLCQNSLEGHIVTNLPDGINDRAIRFFERFAMLAQGYGYQVKVLFVMNTLPDGLNLFARLVQSFPDIIPVKNLHFGREAEFAHFDCAYGPSHGNRALLLPAMRPAIMLVVRESNLAFADFIAQSDNAESNTTYAKLVTADWRDATLEAFDDILMGE